MGELITMAALHERDARRERIRRKLKEPAAPTRKKGRCPAWLVKAANEHIMRSFGIKAAAGEEIQYR